jgi:cytochrome P450
MTQARSAESESESESESGSDVGRKAGRRVSLDNTDPALAPRLFEALAEVQSACPVAWSDAAGGFWALTKHADIAVASNDWETFTVTEGITIPETGKTVQLIPAELDPPEHTAYRRFVLPSFTPRGLARWRPHLEQIVAEAFGAVAAAGAGDLVRDVARRVPVRAICLLLGVTTDWNSIQRLGEAFLVTTSDTGNRASAVEAAAELERILRQEIADRRAHPGDDLLSQFLQAEVLGRPLDDRQALGLCVLLIIAGHGTTSDGIGTLLLRVMTEPGLRGRLLADRSIAGRVIDESLRVDPPVWNMARTVKAETEVRGARLCPGEKVMLAYGAANRDPDKFEHPADFDIDRAGLSQHQSFGTGRHRCVGEGLARLELQLVLDYMLDHAPDLQVAGEVTWAHTMNSHGLAALPVRRAGRPQMELPPE